MIRRKPGERNVEEMKKSRKWIALLLVLSLSISVPAPVCAEFETPAEASPGELCGAEAAPAEDVSPASEAVPAPSPAYAAETGPAVLIAPEPGSAPVPESVSDPTSVPGAETVPSGEPSPAVESLPDTGSVSPAEDPPADGTGPDTVAVSPEGVPEENAPSTDEIPPVVETNPSGDLIPAETADPTEAEVLPGEENPDPDTGDTPETETAGGASVPAADSMASGSVTVTVDSGERLTVIVNGVPEESRDELISEMEQGLGMTLSADRQSLTIRIPGLPDAEKYSITLSDYDSMMCWAATAANMLWSSGYAQCAVNPATGKTFGNVDEVFDYFRGIFTDENGVPDGAVSVFMDGSYPYAGSAGASQLTGTPEGLLPDADYEGALVSLSADYSNLSLLENQAEASFGVLLHGIGNSLAHWLTAVGLVLDETVPDAAGRYKAIILSDSDNDAPGGSGAPNPARTAAQAPDTLTVYRLALDDVNNSTRWTIWYADSVYASIDWLFWLGNNPDRPKPERKEKQPEAKPERKASSARSSEPGLYDVIKARMVREDVLMYSPAGWRFSLSADTSFRVYVRTSATFLTAVCLDDQALASGRDYSVSDCGNGIFLLVLSRDALHTLPAGRHTLRLSLTGIDGAEHSLDLV